ncbi:MAG: hypothetical protein KDA41_09005, partial [Planctomycetales bacterium]|nr:hypothetical protein [Planctomycetales bacterium]
ISKVELFMTRDAGRTWQPLGEDPDRKSPFHVSVPGEGVYGFRIAVAGRNGLASRPPKTGDRPELWVRVDAGEPLFRGNLRAAGMQTAASEPAALSSSASAAPTTAPKAQPKANADNPNANADWQAHLAQAIVALEGELASGADGDDKRDDKQTDNNSNHAATSAEEQAQLDARLRLLYVAAGRQEEALRSSRHQSADEHEFWSHQLQALKMMVEPQRNLPPQRQAAAALVELRDAGDRLAAISELQIKNLTFCTGAHSFGSYETSVADGPWQHKDYRDRKFEAEQPVVMYFEVDSFASEQHTSREFPDGAWRTSLRGSYSIVDASGRPVEQRELKLRDDLCQNRRRDYFVAYKMWMPKLNPGHYSLELLVEDALAGKIGASSIDFEIVSR